MPRFGWARLAYLLFVLTVLAALVRLGSPAAETRSLAAEIPRDTTASGTTAGGTTANGGTPSAAAKARETTGMPRRIDGAVSSLVDMRGNGTVDAAKARSTGPGAWPLGSEAALSEAQAPAITPPVFYRPPPPRASSGDAPAPGTVCGDLGRFPESSRVVFPLEDRYFYSYEDTWGAPRTQGGHEGADLMAPTGTPEYAVTDGTVVPVAGSNENGWNTLGGYAVMVRADYSVGPVREGDLFYYAHLDGRSPLKIGTRVRAGQVVGYSGDTGQGPEVTRGLFPPHLHLGWYDATGARSAVDSGAMNPYPLLEWIKANGGAVTGGSNTRYCEAPSPPTPVPSTGEKGWPAPDAPGVRPDLDTGSNDPKPSPVVLNEASTRTARRAGPAKRAIPKRPARALQDRPPHRDQRDAPAKAPKTERSKSPKPRVPETRETELPATKPRRPEPKKPGPLRREPSGREAPKSSASVGGAPPSRERPSPGRVGEEDTGVSRARPTLQDALLQDLLESLVPDPDREPADTGKRDRPDGGRRGENKEKHKNEKGQAEGRAKRDREEEPERPPNPSAEQASPKDEPSPPDPQSEEPDQEATEPETTEPEADEPEIIEPLPETTAAPETTTG